jgi:Ribosomal protein L23.
MIKKAVEDIFDVTVEDIKTAKYIGKLKELAFM